MRDWVWSYRKYTWGGRPGRHGEWHWLQPDSKWNDVEIINMHPQKPWSQIFIYWDRTLADNFCHFLVLRCFFNFVIIFLVSPFPILGIFCLFVCLCVCMSTHTEKTTTRQQVAIVSCTKLLKLIHTHIYRVIFFTQNNVSAILLSHFPDYAAFTFKTKMSQ